MKQNHKKRYWKTSLRAKIIAWSLIPTGIILCLVALVMFFALQQATETSVLEQDKKIAYLTANQLSVEIRSYLEPLNTLSRWPGLYSDDVQTQYMGLASAQSLFAMTSVEAYNVNMALLNAQGEVLLTLPETLAPAGEDWSSREYYQKVLHMLARDHTIRPLVSNMAPDGPQGTNVVVGANAVIDPEGIFTGVLLVMLPVDAMYETSLIDTGQLGSRSAIIVDGHGQVIYHPNRDYVGADFSAQQAVQNVMAGEWGAIRTQNVAGESTVASYAPIPDTPWGIVTEIRWKELYGHTQVYRYFLSFLLLLAIIVPVFVISIGVKKITKPITDLMTAVEDVASGNFDQITTIHSGDELEALAHQFNEMAAKVHGSYQVLEQKVAARTRELATLNAIAGVVNQSLDLETTLQDALKETLDRLQADVGCIHLYNPEDQSLTMHVYQGMSQAWVKAVEHLQPGEGISGHAVEKQKPLVLDVSHYPTERLLDYVRDQNLQTLAATPIISKGHVLGSLFVGATKARTFPPEEKALLFAIGQQIGVGVENARLYTQAQQELLERKRAQERLRWVSEERARRNRELLLLNRVIAATTSQLEPHAVLEAVARELAQAFDIPQAAVALLDESRETLTVVAEHQSSPDGPSALNAVIPVAGNPSTQYVLERKISLAIMDAQNDPRLAPAHELMRRRGVRSLLLLPLIVRGEVVGTIGLDSLVQREFTQEEIDLATNAVAAAAQALEKARAEEEMRASEVRFRELFNRSPIGIFRTTPAGLILDANPTLLDLLGFESVEEGNQFGLPNLYVDPDDRARLLELLQQGPVSDFETRFHRSDGEIIHVSMRAALTYGEDGQPEFLQGTLVDITERREAERALRESRERLQLAIEGAGLGFWDLNLVTGEQVMNYDWWDYLGYPPEEKATHFEDVAQLVHPDDRGKMADAFNDHLSGKQALYEIEFRMQAKSGTWVWVLFRGKVVAYDERGKPLRMAGISQNITARKEAEQALRESEERLKVAMEAAGLGLWDQNLVTQELVITNYDRGHVQNCCFEEGKTELKNIESKAHPEDQGRLMRALDQHLSGETPLYEVEFRVPDANGAWRWQLHRGRVVNWDETGRPTRMTGIHEDITARKEAEEELRQAKEAAEAANRAKSVFLANMSHELRTPLNAILGFTQLMSRDMHMTPSQRENLETINRSGQHLLTLINDVLEMSKIEAGRTTLYEENFDLYRMLDALEDMFYLRATQKDLQLLFERESDVPHYVRTDESKLRQVLINLLSNAIKFTEKGGVTIRVGVEEKPPATQRAAGEEIDTTRDVLKFEVADTGVGIAPDDLEDLFDPFVQTASGHESKEGTGLGLPISQQYVQLMGGKITVESEVGRGSTFCFTIKIQRADASDVRVETARRRVVGVEQGQHAADGGAYRLLIAEDKWTNRQLLVRLLRPLGFELREAHNGQEAIDVWEAWDPHLIWMDMRMPVMDGHEATQYIKATTKGQATVIIALTASAFEEERRVILSEGCDDFVRKPFREADIFAMLEKHLGIRFVYEELSQPTTQPVPEAQDQLTAEALAALPTEWVEALNQAAVEADTQRILDVAADIRDRNPALANAIVSIVHEFRFDIIMELTQYQ